MSKQKEDVLLMVKHVRYKKVDGTLYVNSGRVAWRNQTSDSFRISAAFEDIRVQRISPDQKEKVQLQLLMHNGESFTFQFADPGGRCKQLELRNSVKEMLQGLLPKFKDKAHSELKEKFRVLESHPEILALYKELVVTGILSSDEFWARPEFSHVNSSQNESQRKPDPRSAKGELANSSGSQTEALNNSSQISRSFQLIDRPQLMGVPSYLLSDIKPEADGANGIKYNLTHETIDAIFRAYPTVRQRHRDLVPDKLSEADFWIKFFQSHYFHRDRVQLPKDDIFAECATMDERHFQNEVRRSRRNRVSAHLDLESLLDYDVGVGYGTAPTGDSDNMFTAADGQLNSGENLPTRSAKLSANQLLLRRFNNHSILVLKTLGTNDIVSGMAPSTRAGDQTNNSQGSGFSNVSPKPVKDRIYGKELSMDEKPLQFPLDLVNVNDYLEGPASKELELTGRGPNVSGSTASSRPVRPAISSIQAEKAVQQCRASMQAAYKNKHRPDFALLSALDAQLALVDISPGGCLLGGKFIEDLKSARPDIGVTSGSRLTGGSRIARVSPAHPQRSSHDASGDEVDRGPTLLNSEQARELSLLYASASELLRHFWACFPVTTPQLEEKLERIAGSLTRFRNSKVLHFAASVDPSFASKHNTNSPSDASSSNPQHPITYRSRVTGHLECMLDAAQRKYSEWNSRQRR